MQRVVSYVMTCLCEPESGNFYDVLDILLPGLTFVTPDQIPQPYHQLLVHDDDISAVLRQYCNHAIHLKTLRVTHEPGSLYRQVLVRTDEERVIGFGASRIYLERLHGLAHQDVLGCYKTLGAILEKHQIPYLNHPKHLTIVSDESLDMCLDLPVGTLLYGRLNKLTTPRGETIGETLEILPPMERQE